MQLTMARRDVPSRDDDDLREKRKEVLFTPEEWQELMGALPRGAKSGTYIRDAALSAVRGQLEAGLRSIETSDSDEDGAYDAPFLAKAPCGPWRDAVQQSDCMSLSKDIVNALEVKDGDIVVMAVGESMEGVGIFDNSLLVMRPVTPMSPPRAGEVTLVQALVGNEDDPSYVGTIKHYERDGRLAKLTDGKGKLFALPKGTFEVRPVAVLRGIIARR